MTEIYPMRFWGIVGRSDSGKTTFLATNAEPDQAWVDPDHRVEFVRKLAPGKIIKSPDRRAHALPEFIWDWLEGEIYNNPDANSVVFDGMTKVFERLSRQAAMRMNLSADERKQRGLNTNKRTDSLDKSNAMSIIRNSPMLGVSCYFVWHVRDIDDRSTKTSISDMELKILNESMAVILDFSAQGSNYFVTVTKSRDLNGRPANTGFTLTDPPGNFWRGGALRLERAMYTTFNTEGEAINWAMEKLGKGDYGEVEAHFQDVTRKYRDWPVKIAMWVDDIYSRVDKPKSPTEVQAQAESNGKSAEPVAGNSWANAKVGLAVKVTGNSGTVDGVFKGIDGKLVKVEVEGKPFSVSAERVSIPAQSPTDDIAVVEPEVEDEVSADEWAQMNAAIDEARAAEETPE